MKYILITLSAVVLTFFTIAVLFFNSNASIGEQINFSTIDQEFQFSCMPSKGRDFDMMHRAFEEFKSKNNAPKDTKIYRTTRKNYFKVAKWASYKSLPEWNHEFKAIN